ncbi:MAG: DNA translocase FtsK 4TM domain-containing protein, partial [Acidobacteriota bacterium]
MDHKKHEIWALCVLTVTLLVLFSLVSYHSSDLTFFSASTAVHTPKNWVGSFGANIAWSFLFVLGLGAYVLPFLGLWVGTCLFRGTTTLPLGRIQAVGFVLLVLSTICLLALYFPQVHLFGQPVRTGGRIGDFYTDFFLAQLGALGTAVLLIGTFLVSLVLSTPFTLKATLEWLCRSTFMGGKAVCRGVVYCCKNVKLPARKDIEAPPPPVDESPSPRIRASRRK